MHNTSCVNLVKLINFCVKLTLFCEMDALGLVILFDIFNSENSGFMQQKRIQNSTFTNSHRTPKQKEFE